MEVNEKKQNLRAFGLLESIIAIGIFGVTIVIGLSLIVKSLAIIKDNQIADQAAAFTYSSLEYARSPLVEPDSLSVGQFYKVERDPDLFINGITNIPPALILEASDSSCNSSSEFIVDIDGPDSSGVYCNQITVSNVNGPDSDYIIKSIGVFKIRNGYRLIEFIGYKSKSSL